MDAISALKTAGVPQYGFGGLDLSQGIGGTKKIGVADLDKVSPEITTQAPGASQAPGSFQNLLGSFVNEVSAQQSAASDTVNGLLSGKNVSLHQAMISMQEANISFQMMVEVRNKLLDSYQELMRMSV